MLSVDMSSAWEKGNEKIVKCILEATEHIILYRNSSDVSKKILCELFKDIIGICRFWVGNTYIGCQKADDVKGAFQFFFEKLMELLLNMKGSDKEYEKNIADMVLYRGKVYRYLGNAFLPDNSDNIVSPIFDDVYVSWSKNSENSYITSKLHGTITWLSCEISEPLYGIDLDKLYCSRADEHEVVFPTIEKCITEIKYI